MNDKPLDKKTEWKVGAVVIAVMLWAMLSQKNWNNPKVYVSAAGHRYHYFENCAAFLSRTEDGARIEVAEMQEEEAESRGIDACVPCYEAQQGDMQARYEAERGR